MFKKKIPPPVMVVMPDDDLKKVASFFQALISVDRRISKISKEKTSRRSAKLVQRKNEELGSQIKQALIILYNHCKHGGQWFLMSMLVRCYAIKKVKSSY